MVCYVRKLGSRLLLAVGLVLWLWLIVSHPQPAIAAIHKYPESSTQVMYRSQQSLRDAKDQAWQAVLFKRLKLGQVDSVHLRLVGFPGITEVAHPRPLQILVGTGEIWTAADALGESLLPANVGEYDLKQAIAKLDKDVPLRLEIPLKDGQVVELLVPPFAVREWRRLMNYPLMEL